MQNKKRRHPSNTPAIWSTVSPDSGMYSQRNFGTLTERQKVDSFMVARRHSEPQHTRTSRLCFRIRDWNVVPWQGAGTWKQRGCNKESVHQARQRAAVSLGARMARLPINVNRRSRGPAYSRGTTVSLSGFRQGTNATHRPLRISKAAKLKRVLGMKRDSSNHPK